MAYDIDQTKEGDYPITLSLENDLEKKIEQNWKKKLKIRLENGTCQVKNKYGTWEEKSLKNGMVLMQYQNLFVPRKRFIT